MKRDVHWMFLRFIVSVLVCISCMCQPVSAEENGVVTSPFGWRYHPVSGDYRFHDGIDIAYDYGTPVVAMKPGMVYFAGSYGGYGNCVILCHDNDEYTLYAHCSELAVSEGSLVGQYDTIGYVGSTGLSTGPHLHLTWIVKGEYCDPMGLFD